MRYKIDMESVKALASAEANIKQNSMFCIEIYYNAETGRMWDMVVTDNDILNYGDSVIKVTSTLKNHSVEWYIKKLEEQLKEIKWIEDDLRKDGWPCDEWLARYGIEV